MSGMSGTSVAMERFRDRVVLITGGASGIGRAAVSRFAQEGARVVLVDLESSDGEALAADLRGEGHDVTLVAASVTDEAAVEAVYRDVRDQHGRLDVLVNNAGIVLESFGATTPLAEWRQVLEVNLDGAFLMARSAIPLMVESGGGAIVNLASMLGHVSVPGAASYVASKHAVVGLTKSLALEHARDGVRVNAVCPGFIKTPMIALDIELDPTLPGRHPIGRLGEPEEVVAVVAFLASDEASFVTGSSYVVDGGYTVQ